MPKPVVVVTSHLPGGSIDVLAEFANLVMPANEHTMARNEVMAAIGRADGIICLLADRIDAEVISKSSRLKVISNYAVGYNNIDVAAATKKGILVTNTPGVLREATADLTFALLLAAARKIPQADRYVREGRFKGWYPSLFLGHEVHGKTIGIVGMGDIGAAVARRARGFGMEVLYHNRRRNPVDEELPARMVSLEELLVRSDFVTLHAPLNDETRHMIGRREFALMKETAILVNASRGELVDEAELVKALVGGEIAGAALDVYEHEPEIAPGLAGLDNVVLAPHIGSATTETRKKMAEMAVGNLVDALQGRRPKYVVNPEVLGQQAAPP